MSEGLPDLVFRRDGTLPPEALEALPEEMRARVTSPEFIEHAKMEIRKARIKSGELLGGRRETKLEPIRIAFGAPGFNRKARRRQMAALKGLRK